MIFRAVLQKWPACRRQSKSHYSPAAMENHFSLAFQYSVRVQILVDQAIAVIPARRSHRRLGYLTLRFVHLWEILCS
jgi:hypothetical protein